jgi:multiple sugar transport system substrate-binding protein
MIKTQYEKASRIIRELVLEQRKTDNKLIPSESQLEKELQISRNTIRKVIGELVEEGVLTRIRGKGTFITDKHREITFSRWVGKKTAELSSSRLAMEQIVSGFEKENPGLKVNVLRVPIYQYHNSILNSLIDQRSLDVVTTNILCLSSFINLDLFVPLNDIIDQNNLHKRYMIDIESGVYKDKLLAVNWTLCPYILYYNKIVFERAGLDPDKPPQTLGELKDMAVKINRTPDNTIHGIAFPQIPGDYAVSFFYPFLLAFKGGFLDSLNNLVIKSEDNIQALQWLSDLLEQGGIEECEGLMEGRTMFATDHLGFWIDGPYARGDFRKITGLEKEIDSHYGVTTIPVGPSGKSESILLTHALAIPRVSRNIDLAYRWIEHLTVNEENAKLYYNYSGMIPCMRDFLHAPFYLSDRFASVVIKQLGTASLLPLKNQVFTEALPFISHIFSLIVREHQRPEEKLSLLLEIMNIISASSRHEFYNF